MRPTLIKYSSLLLLLVAILWLSGYRPAQAADNGQSLTLSEAIRLALTQHPEILSARAQLNHSLHQVSAARSQLLPRLNLSETFQRTNNPMQTFETKLNQSRSTQNDFDPDQANDPDGVNNFTTALTLDWSLYDGGRSWAGLSQAHLQILHDRLGVQKAEQDVITQTALAYIGRLFAQENLHTVTHTLETAQSHQKIVSDRLRGGFAVKSDLLRAEVRIAELIQEKLSAESQVSIASNRLNAAMGYDLDTPLNLAAPFQAYVAVTQSQDEWIKKALEYRPELKQLKLQREIAQKQVRINRSGHLPQLMLNGAYEVDSESFSDSADSYTVGATVQLNLYAGSGISAKIRAARSALEKVTALQKGLRRDVEIQTREAYLGVRNAWKRITVAQQAAIQSAEGLNMVMKRYRSGLLTIVDLLDAQVADQQTRGLHLKALHDYKVARIKLAAAAGTINVDFQ